MKPYTTRARREGSIAVYSLGLFITAIGMGAYVVDTGFRYTRRAEAQRAADAGALAAAQLLSEGRSVSEASAAATRYANLNNSRGSGNPYSVQVVTPFRDVPSWVRVAVGRPEPTFFFAGFGRVPVGARATAEFRNFVPAALPGSGDYGQPLGPANLSLFGPDGEFVNGDAYSVKFARDPQTGSRIPNPRYTGKGFDFLVNVPADYRTRNNTNMLSVEVFDPDTFNKDNLVNPQWNSPTEPYAIDELRTSDGSAGGPGNATRTQYTLVYDRPGYAPVEVGRGSWAFDSTSDMKWIELGQVNLDMYPVDRGNGRLRLNVTSTEGSSENAYNLRAGPPRDGTTPFDPNNGTNVTTNGPLPMNINLGGDVTIPLGYIPPNAAGKRITITNFDTDVGSTQVRYKYRTPSGVEVDYHKGKLSTNGTFATDELPALPANYAGGTWYAQYNAGAGDTSSWSMSYPGANGAPGGVRLISTGDYTLD